MGLRAYQHGFFAAGPAVFLVVVSGSERLKDQNDGAKRNQNADCHHRNDCKREYEGTQ
jgi:hypothetical protein